MINLYGLRDVNANYIAKVDIFSNDLVAYREYFLTIQEGIKTSKGVIKEDDYEVIHLGYMDEHYNISSVNKVITKEYIQGLLESVSYSREVK